MSLYQSAPENDLTNYTYEPESDIESEVEEEVAVEVKPVEQPIAQRDQIAPAAVPVEFARSNAVELDEEQVQGADIEQGQVPGFQLVQAKGLTDTSTKAPKGSSIPSFATAQPTYNTPMPHHSVPTTKLQLPMPYSSTSNQFSSPLVDNSKSSQFVARSDYMISEFFQRQVSRLTLGAPEAINRSYRVFQQKFKESLGAQWAHVTSQPEVEEAIKHIQSMYDYFDQLEKMVTRQMQSLQKVNDVESELSIWYKREGLGEQQGSIRDDMLHMSTSYSNVCNERNSLILAYEQYSTFLNTFKNKAIADAIITMKKQYNARVELDAFGSKLGKLEEKKLKTFARTPTPIEAAALEKELGTSRSKFQDAKLKYQQQSTALIDKAGLLDLKKGADFSAHLSKIRMVHDSFNRGRVGVQMPLEEEEYNKIDKNGLPIQK